MCLPPKKMEKRRTCSGPSCKSNDMYNDLPWQSKKRHLKIQARFALLSQDLRILVLFLGSGEEEDDKVCWRLFLFDWDFPVVRWFVEDYNNEFSGTDQQR